MFKICFGKLFEVPGNSMVKKKKKKKKSACSAGDTVDGALIPGLGKSPRGGNENRLQYSCLENPTDRGAWQATAHGDPKSCT